MAKQSSGKVGSSRIRLVVFEADIADGSDISQVTQAIQNALRPQQIIQQRIVNQVPSNGALMPPTSQLDQPDLDMEQDEAPQVDEAVHLRKPKETRIRRTVVPKAVEMQPDAIASWRDFAATKSPASDLDRALVVAAWHSEHQGNEPVTPGHVYTCYRYMKWPIGMSDFGSPLRKLKQQQRLNSAGRAAYTITQMGLQDVDEMGGTAE